MQATGNNSIIKRPRLTIRIGQNSLSFAAIDSNVENQIIYEPYIIKSGVSIAANLREALKAADILSVTWYRALVLLDSPVILIPIEEFDEAQKDVIYNHSITGQEGAVVLSSVIPMLNCVALYSISKDLKTVVEDNFGDVCFSHVCIPVWTHLNRRSYTGSNNKLFCYFYDKKLDVFSFRQNRFKFSNSFKVKHAHDASYFILYVWQQLSFNSKTDELHLVGDFAEREQLVEELREYLKNVYIINPTAEFNRASITQIKGIPYDIVTLFIKGR